MSSMIKTYNNQAKTGKTLSKIVKSLAHLREDIRLKDSNTERSESSAFARATRAMSS